MDAFKQFKDNYQLRITLHPSITKSFNQEEIEKIKQIYYYNTLVESGFDRIEIDKMITNTNTLEVASVSIAMFSSGSSTSTQAVFIGTRAKNIILEEDESREISFPGVKNLNSPQFIAKSLLKWLDKDRYDTNSEAYRSKIQKLNIPNESTESIIENLII
ncbi:hypothetical protein [Legionella tunisiensis]|uniref:hypothetical protein n=1 Tax=Legionella tunisiensis TaxID=1034944 RepID=UPI00031188AB|nr:hypothetical protein [Legionella tunisiensis]